MRKILTILVATLFAATNVSAFTYITGSGTDVDPYWIGSTEAWNELCAAVQGGHSFSGEFIKQTADFTVSERMAVHHEAPQFCGEYDGDGHIMNLDIHETEGAADSRECAAPFGVINTAWIKNLHITGEVSTNFMRPASLVGFVAGGTSHIYNCWSEVNISSSRSGDIDAGGFVARVNEYAELEIEGCLFSGEIRYTNENGWEGGGFVGFAQSYANVRLLNCVYAPDAMQLTKHKSDFYVGVGGNHHGTLNNCYHNGIAATAELNTSGSNRAFSVTGYDGVEVHYSNSYSPTKTYYVSGIETYTHGMQVGNSVIGATGATLPVSYWGSESDVYIANGEVLGSSPHDFTIGSADYTIYQPSADVYYNSDHHYYAYNRFDEAVAAWGDNTTLILLRNNIEHNSTIVIDGVQSRTLDLNGRCLQFTGATGEVLQVTNGAELTIIDNNPTTEHKFSVDANNFAILDEASGTVTINGGCITGGKGGQTKTPTTNEDGGAIFINGGTVTMNGGTLIGNQANRHAGGVFVTGGGQFTLNAGAAIKHNKAGMFGGGISAYGSTEDVNITAGGEAIINGGVIANNYAPNEAGGIHTNTRDYAVSVTIMGAAEVTGNKSNGNGGGVLVATNATLNMQGNPVISGNYKGSNVQNVYLPAGKKITITGDLGSSSNVGVTMATPGTFTTGLPSHGDETNFFSDVDTYVVSLDADAEAQLVEPIPATGNSDLNNPADFYTTIFYSDKNLKLPAGVEAYTATIDGDVMNLTKVANPGDIIPQNKALVLKSNVKNYTLIPYGVGMISISAANCLLGVDVETSLTDAGITGSTVCYVISGKSRDGSVVGVGFYQYPEPNKLKAHKAYTYIPGTPSTAPQRLRFVFDGTTAIDNTVVAEKAEKRIENGQLVIIRNGVYYNAAGQIIK